MHTRLIILTALFVLIGFATNAFAQVDTPINTSPLTRAGAVALLVESHSQMKLELQEMVRHLPPMPLYDDMDYGQWYAPYIETAFAHGLIAGNELRAFRPGDLLTDDEAIILGARFAAMTDPALAAQLVATGGSYEQLYSVATLSAQQKNVVLPSPVEPGQPMARSDFYAMLSSLGIANPSQIAISHNPHPIVVAAYQQPRAVAPAVPRQNPAPVPIPRPSPAPVPRPSPTPPASPAPVSNKFAISMPSLGITDLTITHPSDPFSKDGLHAPLKYGVGHLFSYPGKGGKILIYGHSSSYAWDVSSYTKIFRQINKLNVGDQIHVSYAGKIHTYEVSFKQTVPAEDMSVYQRPGSEELILYTCWPPDSIKERYLVHARPV